MDRPNFFILGAPKCGTTAMSHFLRQHPDVAVGGREIYWFARDYDFPYRPKTEEDYLRWVGPADGAARLGECSVFYLHSASAPAEIMAFDPDARVIAMIRNPVDMIYSLHSQLLFVESEDIPDFEAAIGADADRIAGRRPLRHAVIRRAGYRSIGRYSEQLRRWFDVLGRDSVHVIVHDDLRADTPAAFRDTCAFLGVDPEVSVSFAQINVNKRARSHAVQRVIQRPSPFVRRAARLLPGQSLRRGVATAAQRLNTSEEPRAPMRPELRAELTAEFAPDVVALSELLGRDLTGWTSGAPIEPPLRAGTR